MNSLILILILSIFIAIYLWLKRKKLEFFAFLFGAIGLFAIILTLFSNHLQDGLNLIIMKIMEAVNTYVNAYEIYPSQGIISVNGGNGIVSILLNYECSGIIEHLVFTVLILFFPFGSNIKMLIKLIVGNIYIIFANILRLLVIIGSVKIWGVDSYYIVHTIIGRLLFFIMMIILYYIIFTKTQLKVQKVGGIK